MQGTALPSFLKRRREVNSFEDDAEDQSPTKKARPTSVEIIPRIQRLKHPQRLTGPKPKQALCGIARRL